MDAVRTVNLWKMGEWANLVKIAGKHMTLEIMDVDR